MVKYLEEDPLVYEDLLVLRFVYKEWPLLKHPLSTKTTVENVNKCLMKMQIRYIRCSGNQDCWLYWNNYTEEGILEFSQPPDTMMEQHTSDASNKPPDITAGTNVLRSDMQKGHTHTTALVKTVSPPSGQNQENKTSHIDTDEELDHHKMNMTRWHLVLLDIQPTWIGRNHLVPP